MSAATSRQAQGAAVRTTPAKGRGWGWLTVLLLVLPVLVASAALLWSLLVRDPQAALGMETATSLLAAGKPDLAANAFDQLIDQGYDAPAVYYGLGVAAGEMGDLGRAEAALRQADAMAPNAEAIGDALAQVQSAQAAQAASGDPLLAGESAGGNQAGAPGIMARTWRGAYSSNRIAIAALAAWSLLGAFVVLAVRHPRRRTLALVGACLSALLLVAAAGALIL